MKSQPMLDPILITTNGTILAGFGRRRAAVFDGGLELNCIEYPEMRSVQAMKWLK